MTDRASASAAAAALSLVGAALTTVLPTPALADTKTLRIVAFGDSLVAGYGLRPGEAFPAQLQAALRAKGYDVTVANAGVSGDTSASALTRVPRAVPAGTDLAIVEFGANDILRGVSPSTTERNLDVVLSRVTTSARAVILAGMIAPPGIGNAFSRSFDPIYGRLAERHGATLYPFFLTGVAGRANLNLPDRIHPNAAGVRRIVEGILPAVRRELDVLARSRAARM